jgi:hypothetical protein
MAGVKLTPYDQQVFVARNLHPMIKEKLSRTT